MATCGLGTHLQTQLGQVTDDSPASWLRQELFDPLNDFERESRLLRQLADTGRFVQLLERSIETALDLLKVLDAPTRGLWHQKLKEERLERVQFYHALLLNRNQLAFEMGDEQQQLEVQTLLKCGVERYHDLLLPEELDVISAVYDAVLQQSKTVVGVLPTWFTTSEHDWQYGGKYRVSKDEEACVRQVALWAKLNHPSIRKLYGACHVGKAFAVCPNSYRARDCGHFCAKWRQLLSCALGLQYLHSRGLVHRRLTVDTLRYIERGDQTVLSGLGLVRLDRGNGEITSSCVYINESAEDSDDDGSLPDEFDEVQEAPSVAADVLAFGVTILQLLAMTREVGDSGEDDDDDDDESYPSFLDEEEATLLNGMLAEDPEDRITVEEAIECMKALASHEKDDEFGDSEDESDSAETLQVSSGIETVEDVTTYIIPTASQSIEEVLLDAEALCDELEDADSIHRQVYDRLMNVYNQLVVVAEPLPLSLVESFAALLWRFLLLEQRSSDGYSVVATLCASRTVAGRNYSLHHDLDRLLRSSSWLQDTADVHQWQPTVKQTQRQQHEAMQTCLEDPSTLLAQLDSEDQRAEAMALLQYESRSAKLPRWFLPAYQVEIGWHLADGSFGAVYLGKWLGTDVVVKKLLTVDLDRKAREEFRREADLWFSLNHSSLLKMFGACHEGRPLFVCELANLGTASAFLRGKSWREVWWALWEAALGLQHLHARGIVHGDLKGNNILVSGTEDSASSVKLADFGLSAFVDRREESAASDGAVGAYRWKAPECLSGSGPSFASDVYSFGMCILEIVTGEFPWGKAIPDEAVRFHVEKEQRLPPRPEGFADVEWELLERMCCFEPRKRMSAGAVVTYLHNLLDLHEDYD